MDTVEKLLDSNPTTADCLILRNRLERPAKGESVSLELSGERVEKQTCLESAQQVSNAHQPSGSNRPSKFQQATLFTKLKKLWLKHVWDV